MDRFSNLDPTTVNTGKAELSQLAPTEAFPCPACGQMLAPTCRVCVACQTPIDFTQLTTPEAQVPVVRGEAPRERALARARFSWGIFFGVLSLWLLAAIVTTRWLGPNGSQIMMGTFVLVSSIWIFYDAQKKGISKPLRWGVGSLLLWILVFPWYLARRRTPRAPCPFIEGETGPVARALFFVLLVFFVLGALLVIFQGPPPK